MMSFRESLSSATFLLETKDHTYSIMYVSSRRSAGALRSRSRRKTSWDFARGSVVFMAIGGQFPGCRPCNMSPTVLGSIVGPLISGNSQVC